MGESEKLIDELFEGLEDLEIVNVKEATALPETAATIGSSSCNSCSCCGSSSCCSS